MIVPACERRTAVRPCNIFSLPFILRQDSDTRTTQVARAAVGTLQRASATERDIHGRPRCALWSMYPTATGPEASTNVKSFR
jgi:hypothetical protein